MIAKSCKVDLLAIATLLCEYSSHSRPVKMAGQFRDLQYREEARSCQPTTCNLVRYIDLHRYRTVPHEGSGLALDRLLGNIAGILNLRVVVPYSRDKMLA